MEGGLRAAFLVSPRHHLRTPDFLSKRWGPPHGININNSILPAGNITMDQPRANNNATNGIFLYGVTGGPGFTSPGSPYACIHSNYGNQLNAQSSAAVYTSFILSCPQ
jgi:hypothetical protein